MISPRPATSIFRGSNAAASLKRIKHDFKTALKMRAIFRGSNAAASLKRRLAVLGTVKIDPHLPRQ